MNQIDRQVELFDFEYILYKVVIAYKNKNKNGIVCIKN